MNSYFATVEQQANPLLLGKPVAVLGSHAKRTIIVAASVEAKRFGVKTGTRIEDAPKLCPNIVFVHGEPRKYSWVTKMFIEIFEKYTDKVEIFSIDEAFLDVTKTAQIFGGAEAIARKIKADIKREIGEYITCSVGIASNKFLAKTASDLVKPDGLVVVTPQNQDEILLNIPLADFCGIGRRITQRLGALGIYTTLDLRKAPNLVLNKEFGIATGQKLKRMSYGLDSSPVISWHDRADAKSYSHSRTLNKDVTSPKEIERHVLLLSEKVGEHMRKDGMLAIEVSLWLRFKDFSGIGKSLRLARWTHDGLEIALSANRLLKEISICQPVRAIGVCVGGVQKENNVTSSWLPEEKINERALRAIDFVNRKCGEGTVTRARLAGVKMKEIVSGMGRDKFE